MSNVETIKSYLVSLGFTTDKKTLNDLHNALDSLNKKILDYVPKWAKTYAAAAVTIAGALSAVNMGMAKIAERLSKDDLAYKQFALRMFTSAEAAKKMKISMDALGQSMEDIAWNPELTKRYKDLNALQGRVMPPAEYENQMKRVRDIYFEVTKLQVIVQYGVQRVAYYFIKYMDKPIRELFNWLQKITGDKDLETTLDRWSEKIARWLVTFSKLGESGFRFFKDMWDVVKKLWENTSNLVKVQTILEGIGFLFLASGPFGRALITMSSLLLLVDDFYHWHDKKPGKNMAFWDNLFGSPEEFDSKFGNIKKKVQNWWKGFFGEGGTWSDWMGKIVAYFKKGGGFDSLLKGMDDLLNKTVDWFNYIIHAIPLVFQIAGNYAKAIGEMIAHPFSAAEIWDKAKAENEELQSQMGASPGATDEERQKVAQASENRHGLLALYGSKEGVVHHEQEALRSKMTFAERYADVHEGLKSKSLQEAKDRVERWWSGSEVRPGGAGAPVPPRSNGSDRHPFEGAGNTVRGWWDAAHTFFTPDPNGKEMGPAGGGGSPTGHMQTIKSGKSSITGDDELIRRYLVADAAYEKDHPGKHIAVHSSFRNFAQQTQAWNNYQTGKGGIAARPGHSRHERGLAIDVTNWQEARKYLIAAGFDNSVPHDDNHFQILGSPHHGGVSVPNRDIPAKRYHNPANLHLNRQRGAAGKASPGGLAIFPDDATGYAAAVRQVEIWQSKGLTLAQMADVAASGTSDENKAKVLRNLTSRLHAKPGSLASSFSKEDLTKAWVHGESNTKVSTLASMGRRYAGLAAGSSGAGSGSHSVTHGDTHITVHVAHSNASAKEIAREVKKSIDEDRNRRIAVEAAYSQGVTV